MRERMDNLFRYIPELKPKKAKRHLRRFWKNNINPSPERSIFVSPEELPVTAFKINETQTGTEPKQASYSSKANLLLVTCMKGMSPQFYSLGNKTTSLESEIPLGSQCVEVVTENGLAFVTTTNFERPPRKTNNQLHIIDIQEKRVISSVDTEGNWSKFIATNSDHSEVLVSNWHSHNISVIDIHNIHEPKVIKKLNGEKLLAA